MAFSPPSVWLRGAGEANKVEVTKKIDTLWPHQSMGCKQTCVNDVNIVTMLQLQLYYFSFFFFYSFIQTWSSGIQFLISSHAYVTFVICSSRKNSSCCLNRHPCRRSIFKKSAKICPTLIYLDHIIENFLPYDLQRSSP